MQYISHYSSPLGNILLAADETGLTGLWFEGQKYFALYLDKVYKEKELPVLKRTKQWLDLYFPERTGFTVPFILQERIFKMKCGKFSVQFPMERP